MADAIDRGEDRSALVHMIVRDLLWILKYAALFGVLVLFVPLLARYGISQIKFGDAQIDLIDTTAGKVVDVSQDLKAARAEIGELRLIVDRLIAERSGGFDAGLKNQIQEYRLEQTVSVETPDRVTANLSKVQQEGGVTGYMWIGNFDNSTGRWRDTVLVGQNNRDYAGKPQEIVVGQTFTIDTAVNVREYWPDDSEDYLTNLRVIGIANERGKVRVLEPPRAYTRTNNVDAYWIRVTVIR